MAEKQWLRLLKVRVAGHDGVQVGLGLVEDGKLQLGQCFVEGSHTLQQVQAQVGGHLVVARAAGVELTRHRADEFAQPALDGGVDVFVARLDLENPKVEFGAHLLQTGDQLIPLVVRDDPCPRLTQTY